MLASGGYRICETGQALQVTCETCVDIARIDHSWFVTTNSQEAGSAEFNDSAYVDLLKDLVPREGG